jgi:uncharacterized protein YjbI with pentapeptide repeats
MATPPTQPDCRELIKQDVAGLHFERVHFDSNFTGSTFRQCIFHHCRLDRVLMGKSHWIESQFDGSKLVVCFDDSVFERCSFRDTSIQGLLGEYGGVRARFIGCDFTGATLKSVKLRACKFEHCDFSGARFIDCDLRGAIHDGKELENAA